MNHLTNMHANHGSDTASDGPPIETLVAAILDKKYTMSAKDLAVFESLIDDPAVDSAERKELAALIWNTVACFIDYQWDVARFAPGKKACGSNLEGPGQRPFEASDVVKLEHRKCTQSYNEAASDGTARKGSP
ncbi:MAG: hypothetical protein AAFX04_13195 [Pseudomonadota bacterium]